MATFRKHIIQNIFYRGIYLITQFMMISLFARMLGPTGNGYLSLFLTNCSFLILIISFGIEGGIIYFSAVRRFPTQKLMAAYLMVIPFQLLMVLILAFIYYFFKGQSLFLNHFFSHPIIWGLCYVTALLLVNYCTALLSALKHFRKIYLTLTVVNLLSLSIITYNYFIRHLLQSSLFWVKVYVLIILLSASALLLMTIIASGARFFNPFKEKAVFVALIKYGRLVFLANLLQFLAYRVDIWLVNYFLNKEALGLYSISAKLIQTVWIIPIAMASVILAYANDMKGSAWLKQLVRLLRWVVAAFVVVDLLLLFFSHDLIVFLLGPAFSGATIPFLIILPGATVFILNTLLASYFSGIDKVKINTINSGYCFLIIAGLDVLLIPKHGIAGAALASTIGYGFSGFYAIFTFSKLSGFSFREIFSFSFNDIKYAKRWIKNMHL